MWNNRKIASVFTVLLSAGIAAACDNAAPIAGPLDDAPQFSARAGDVTGEPQLVLWRTNFTADPTVAVLASGGGTLEIREQDGTGTGNVIVRLVIPGGAAPGGPVLYTMALDCDGDGACTIELGAKNGFGSIDSFHKRVKLQINTVYFAAGYDLSKLSIAQDLGDGSYDPSVSTVDEDGFLTATLQHFSAYVPITD